jgi:DNA-binding SARP family transcriptional activator
MTTDVTLRVLGPIELTIAGRPVPLGGPHRRVVLAMLLLGRPAVVPVSRIIDAIWDDRPPRTATVKVQGHISALRKAVAGVGCPPEVPLLQTQPPGYRLAGDQCRSDLEEFVALTDEAAQLRTQHRPDEASALLHRALSRWRGPAFLDISSAEIRRHATRIDQLRLLAVEDKAALDLQLGRCRTVLANLEPLVNEEPLRERARELLIRALLGLGQRSAALRCYEECRRHLRDELGISPGQRLQTLAQAIRHGAPGRST